MPSSNELKPAIRTAIGIALLALAYFVTGRLGLILAVPPGYATLIWPPSGIAIGVLWIHGRKFWPGAFIGSFALNLSAANDYSIAGLLSPDDLTIAAGFATASTLQALFGCELIRRIIGIHIVLRSIKDIAVLLLVAGPLACLVAATGGTAILYFTGKLFLSELPNHWLTWWTGDLFGVFVFLPLILVAPWRERRLIWRDRSPAALPIASMLVVVSLLGATFYAWKITTDYIYERNQARFAALAQESEKALLHRIDNYRLALISGAGFFHASQGKLTSDAWRTYVQALDVNLHYPGINGIGYIMPVRQSEIQAFEQAIRADAQPDFRIHPVTTAADQFVITYIQPVEQNREAAGLAISFESRRLKAALLSRDTGRSAISQRITLVQDKTKSPGFLLLYPLYQRQVRYDTVAARRAAFLGWIYAPFVARNFMTDLTKSQGTMLELTIYGDRRINPRETIFDSAAQKGGPPAMYSVRKQVTVMQQPWTIVWTSTPAFETEMASSEPRIILLGGLLFSGLLGAFLFGIARRTAIVQRLVDEQTHEIAANERQMKLLIRHTPAAMAMFDREMRYILASDRWLKDFKLQDRDITGKSHYKVRPELFSSARWCELLGRVLQGESFSDEEYLCACPDGHTEWIKGAVHPWLDADNRIGGFVLFAEVITEQKMERLRSTLLREIALEASEAPTTEAIIASVLRKMCTYLNWPIGHAYLWDDKRQELVSSKIWYVNDDLQDHTKFQKVSEEITFRPGIGLPGRAHLTKKPVFVTNVATDTNFPRNKLVPNLVLRSALGIPVIVRNEVVAVLEFFALNIFEETEALTNLYELIVIQLGRVIERRQIEKALKASEEMFRLAMENAPIGMALVSPEGNWLNVNKALCDLLGYTAEELKATNVASITHPDDQDTDITQTRRILAGELQSYQMEKRFFSKNHDVIWALLSVSLLRNADGTPRYLIKQIQDIGERKAIEHMKSDFVATVSHELRTPLTSIRGALGLMTGGAAGELPGNLRRLTSIAQENSERLSRLVNDILDVEKLDAGAVKLRPRSASINQLLEHAIASNQQYADLYNVRFVFRSAEGEPHIWVDSDRFEQVVTNLLSNAAKFSRSGQPIDITAAVSDGSAHITVRDYGTGIPKAFRDRIFQQFAQADSTDSKRRQGTGLGLNIAKRLTNAMGGTISFVSEEGVGTAFTLEFPLLVEPELVEAG